MTSRPSKNDPSIGELPLAFESSPDAPPSNAVASEKPNTGEASRVPRVYTYPGVFTAKPQLLVQAKTPPYIQVGDVKYYIGCDRYLQPLPGVKTLSYEHARMVMTVCLLVAERGEKFLIPSSTNLYSIAARTTWRELARLFQYTSAPGKASIKKFEQWLRDLRNFPFAVEQPGQPIVPTYFIEMFWNIGKKSASPSEGTLIIQVSKLFTDFLRDISQSHDIRIDQFLSISGRSAGLLYLWLPAKTFAVARRHQIYRIDAAEAMRLIGEEPPTASNGRVYPSKIKQFFEQHGEKSIVGQLRGKATRTGYWKRVWLSNSDNPNGCGVNLCIEEIRTTDDSDTAIDGPRSNSSSRGILKSYFLSGKEGRTDDDYYQRRLDLRAYITRTGSEFSEYEIEQLDFLAIAGDIRRKNRPCLLEIKALLGSDGLERVLGEVASQVREGKTATGSNLQWVIDVAKSFLDPKRHETEHRRRFAGNSS